jgi:hypothetical protein
MNKKPELEIDEKGNKFWKLNGFLHREDGPAVEWSNDGGKQWWIDGIRHREDGPAIEWSNGKKFWYLNGYPYSKEKWFNLLTPEQKYNYLWNLDE